MSDASVALHKLTSSQTPSPIHSHWEPPSQLTSNLEDYRARRSRCEWRSGPHAAYHKWLTHDEFTAGWVRHGLEMAPWRGANESVAFTRPFYDPPPGTEKRAEAATCTGPAARPQETWRYARVGPAQSSGGYDWHLFGRVSG